MDEPTTTMHGTRPVNRRSVLLGVAGLVVGSMATATDASAQPVLRTSTPVPAWAKRWNAPIYDLDDFLRRDRTARYPHKSVMLTIDDGPSAEWTPRYLRLLAKYHVRATFNMIGEQVKPNKTIVRAVASEGHVIANHTWTHDEALPYGSVEHIRSEIVRTNEVLHDVAGYVPTTFRAPGGVWGPRVFDELARLHMMPLDWDIDPRDWARPGVGAITSAMLAARPETSSCAMTAAGTARRPTPR